MGSDMAMERHIPDSTYAEWVMEGDDQFLNIYRRSGYDGKTSIVWSGTVDDTEKKAVRDLIQLLIHKDMPERPEPVPTLKKQLVTEFDEWCLTDFRGEPFTNQTLEAMAKSVLMVLDRNEIKYEQN